MNAIDALLKVDAKKLTELPQAKLELPRLTKLTGAKFEVTVQALPGELLSELTESNVEYGRHDKVKNTNAYKTGLDIVVNGVVEPDLRSKKLAEHLGAVTPNDVAEKLFLPGEMGAIAGKITELCGVVPQVEVDELVKN